MQKRPSPSSPPVTDMRNDACGLLLKKTKTTMLRKAQNPNDADDANDAESGIWYRDILKTASQASSASLSSRKDAAGVWGTPQKCACGWPHAMLAKHVYPQNGDDQTRCPHKFAHSPEWISLDSSKNLDSKKWISSDSLCTNELLFIKKSPPGFPKIARKAIENPDGRSI